MRTTIELPHARLQDLSQMHDFIEEGCRQVGADEDVAYSLRLGTEEVCTNIIEHGYDEETPGPITLTLEDEPGKMTITIADRARPFSPDDAPPPDLSPNWENRKIGGLGWHLVRHAVDQVLYKPNPGGGNIVTLVKKF